MAVATLRAQVESLEALDSREAARARLVEVAPKLEDWETEFQEFLATDVDNRQIRRRRVDTASHFLQQTPVRHVVLHRRVAFLQYKGLSREEMEAAFEDAGQLQDLMQVLEDSYAPTEVVAEDGTQTGVVGVDGASPSTLTPFRRGESVLAYVQGEEYYPASVECIDEERHGDLLRVLYGWSPHHDLGNTSKWMSPGFKGVVADALPQAAHLALDASVLVAAEGAVDKFVDAVVIAIHTDGTYDLELGTCQRRYSVAADALRTLEHPREVELNSSAHHARMEKDARAKRERVPSAPSFPTVGTKERPVRTRELMALMKGEKNARSVELLGGDEAEAELTEDERLSLGTFIRSFLRYPRLDVEESPPHCRRFVDFVQEFGDYVGRSGAKGMPACPESQETRSGVAFGFDLTRCRRHPACPYLLETNPILDIAHQCQATGHMYVDPDFPPSHRSLFGPAITYGGGPAPAAGTVLEQMGGVEYDYEWRRASELMVHPRAFIPGTQAAAMRRGKFTTEWLPHLFSMAVEGLDFEESFSPSEETCLYGCYTIRLFVDGRWYFVLLDDFVPVDKETGSVVALHSSHANELWPTLLEKVYAKLEGSYAALSDRRSSRRVFIPERVFEDLTGGLAERDEYQLLHQTDDWFDNMCGRQEDGSFCTMLSGAPTEGAFSVERRLGRLGVALGSYHFVRGVVDIYDEDNGKSFRGVLTTHPWSKETVTPKNQENALMGYSAKVLKELKRLEDGDENKQQLGALWLPFGEYMRTFTSCLTCFSFGNWQKAVLHGTFKGREGGSRWLDAAKWAQNPQFHVNLMGYGQLAIQLRLLDRRFLPGLVDGQRLQMSLLRADAFEQRLETPHNSVVTSNFVDFQDADANDYPSVYIYLTVNGGGYVVVPEIGNIPSSEPFVLKLWSTATFHVRPLDNVE